LFYRRTIRQGIVGRPLFHRPIEHFFGLAGFASVVLGFVLYVLAVAWHLTGAASPAPWFMPAMSALLVLNGIQLIASWVLALMLTTLSKRELRMRDDLGAATLPDASTSATVVTPHSAG
jgi:hypothetical protein